MADPFTVLRNLWGMMGAEGTTEGARAYPGGAEAWEQPGVLEKHLEQYSNMPPVKKSYGTQWSPDEVALVQKHFGVQPEKWAKLDHSTQFELLMQASDLEKSLQGVSEFSPPEGFDPSVAYRQGPVPEYIPGQPTVRAYHGTTMGPYDASRISHETFNLPEHYRHEQGVFFTPDPETASRYAGYAPQSGVDTGAKVFPVDLDMQNSVTVDMRKIPGIRENQRYYDSDIVKTAIDAARQNNRDFVVLKGLKDIGGESDQIIAVRPAGKVRSALTGETLFGLLAGLFGAGGPPRKNGNGQTTYPVNP